MKPNEKRILRYTLTYAYRMSPFYHALFKRLKIDVNNVHTFEDLVKLPLTYPEDIRKNQPPVSRNFAFLSASAEDIVSINLTSGTTGVPKIIFTTKDDWKRYSKGTDIIFKAIGIEPGKDIIICTTAHTAGLKAFLCSITKGYRLLNAYTLAPHDVALLIRFLKEDMGKVTLLGLPSALVQLGNILRNKNLVMKGYVKNIISVGEPLNNSLKEKLHQLWGGEVYNVYGMVEFGGIAYECKYKEGLHILEDYIHISIRNPRDLTEPLSPSKEGVAVLTKLLKPGETTGTILINYVTNDITKIISKDSSCKCGGSTLKIAPPYPRIPRVRKGGYTA